MTRSETATDARNGLAGQVSPYLAAHAADPVDWQPWGDEPFERARAEDKPVFLSIGYESCHWCHVMQRESFRDEETARLLNERFVSVKVDREERPDVDSLYMGYVTASTGRGGWPMTVFLTADRVPVLGGTYFPKEPHPAMPSFGEVLRDVAEAFSGSREKVHEAAAASLDFLRRTERGDAERRLTTDVAAGAAPRILETADRVHGGFGDAPKFPQIPLVRFLFANERALGHTLSGEIAGDAVRAMLRGGIYDQAGGGLFRYATDAEWLVPHFEKMLYDQALLLSAIADAYGRERSDELAHAARQTAAFLDAELARPDGLLCSSLSAETEGAEGATYVWPFEELEALLTPDELALAERELGVSREGNWEGANILTRRAGHEEDAEAVDALLARLLEVRRQRPQPERDGKVLVSWNAMAARGLLEAGGALDDDVLLERGRTLLDTLLEQAADGDEVVHVVDDPAVADVRLLEDYAHLASACLSAADTSPESAERDRLRERALSLHEAALQRFAHGPVLYMTPPDPGLPVRPHEQHDSPTPSGAATLAENGVRLAEALGDGLLIDVAGDALRQFASAAQYAPGSVGTALAAALALFRWRARA